MVSKSIFSSAVFLPVLLLHILTTTVKESSAICRSDEHQPQNFKCDWWEDLEQIRRKELVEELIIRNEMPFMCTSAAFVRFPRVKYLRLPSGLFMSVGRDCFNGLKQIAEIDLKNNDLNEFHFNSLNDSTLAFLTLTGNLLRSLNFEQMVLPRLRHLILSKNLLETLYVDRYNFPNIIDISADNNHIHTFFIASDALYTLRLSENDIVGFAADSLKSRSLEYLHLQNNRIRRISLDSFKNLPKVKQIFLDGNPLEVLECSFSNVTEFSLHENMIIVKREDHASFSVHLDWWKVQQLVFSSNRIRSYNLLRRLENSVQELNLDHNELTQIGEGDLATFTNLFVLDMSHNRISTIHYEAFDRLSKLHTLNLAHNCIQHLSGVLFNSLRSITSITLTTNLLTYFPIPGWDNQTNLITQTEYHPLMGIQDLSLANNPMQCDCYEQVLKWIQQLQHFETLRHRLFANTRMIGCMEESNRRCHTYYTQHLWSLGIPPFIRSKNAQDLFKKCEIYTMVEASEPRRFRSSPAVPLPLTEDSNEVD